MTTLVPMTVAEFWSKFDDIVATYKEKRGQIFRSGEVRYDDVVDAIAEMDSLISDWYNQGT